MADVAETIEESGERIGHHTWVEMRLFEIVGRWSGTVSEPRARDLLATQSYHHAWHAELWHGLLPALPHLASAELVAPGTSGDAIVAALAALGDVGEGDGDGDSDDGDGDGEAGEAGGAGGPDATLTRLEALYGMALPALADSYTEHLERTTAITDGPTRRVLHLVMSDLETDRAAGLALIDRLRSTSG